MPEVVVPAAAAASSAGDWVAALGWLLVVVWIVFMIARDCWLERGRRRDRERWERWHP